jgi:hypothetical protein
MTEEPSQLEQLVKRFNATNLLTAVLRSVGPVSIQKEELDKIMNYHKPEDLQDFNAIDTYMDTYMDYIKERGGYAQIDYDFDNQIFTFNLMSKEEAEARSGIGNDIGYVCLRSRWNDYAHS